MYKPFEIYRKKKFPNEETPASQVQEAWSQLSKKKQLKFIKKAEKHYDNDHEPNNHEPPLYTYLTNRELELLMKSYGLPDRLPVNCHVYYINKCKQQFVSEKEDQDEEATIADLKKIDNEAKLKWKNMSKDELNSIHEEFHNASDEFNDNMLDFSRNLPEARVVDYKHFHRIRKRLEDSNETIFGSGKLPFKKEDSPRKAKERAENIFKDMTPYKIFVEKFMEEHPDIKPFQSRNMARSQYSQLSDKKKLKYIKKAEKAYDSFDFPDDVKKPVFTSFLNKKEIKLLFDSYNMPKFVPNNLAAFYYGKRYKEGDVDMKRVFSDFKILNDQQKAEVSSEHAQALEEYTIMHKQFLDNLPINRLDDYNLMKGSKKNKTTEKAAVDQKPTSVSKRKLTAAAAAVATPSPASSKSKTFKSKAEIKSEAESDDDVQESVVKKKKIKSETTPIVVKHNGKVESSSEDEEGDDDDEDDDDDDDEDDEE